MNRFTVEVPNGRIKEYEKAAIISEKPDFLVPMSFIEIGDRERITYNYDGLISLGNIENCLGVKDIFNCLGDIIASMYTASNLLIFPERISLGKDMVYINQESKLTKLIFLPKEIECNPSEELENLINEIEDMYITKGAKEYLGIIRQYIKMNCGLTELGARISMIKRDAFLCGIK